MTAIFGPIAAQKVTGWLPIARPGTETTTGVGGDPGGAFVLARDPYSGASHDQAPVYVPQPQTRTGVGGDPGVAFMLARAPYSGTSQDPYSGTSQGQVPVHVPEPGCVLVFVGAAVTTMAARRFRRR